MANQLKYYQGRIPVCGVSAVYTRAKKPCSGIEINIQRCEDCKTFQFAL